MNTKYNAAYDVHRLNVRDPSGREAVVAYQDTMGQVRFDFVRRAPDLVATAMALRAELITRVVSAATPRRHFGLKPSDGVVAPGERLWLSTTSWAVALHSLATW